MERRVSIAAIILAAGSSTRLGRPKQTVEVGGETLVARAIRTAQEARLSPVIVVVNNSKLLPEVQAQGAVGVLNPEAQQGMATSIVTGVRAASAHNAAGAVIMTCDQIAIAAEHLRALCEHPGTMTGSAYTGVTGVPAYFPARSFAALLGLRGDAGARALLAGARSVATESLAFDVDTEADLERAREFLKEKS